MSPSRGVAREAGKEFIVLPHFVWSGVRSELIKVKWLLISIIASEGSCLVQPEEIRYFGRVFSFESH